ncbi:hypothetical protein [Vibrio mediterranei]|uniref:hypothetical protein n=1 Tax=Vibrio mediterranei TaxID=689 RepID=UPI00406885CF
MKKIFLIAAVAAALAGCSKSDEALITEYTECSGWIAGLADSGLIDMHFSETFHNSALALVEKMSDTKKANQRAIQVGYERENARAWAYRNHAQAEEKAEKICDVKTY